MRSVATGTVMNMSEHSAGVPCVYCGGRHGQAAEVRACWERSARTARTGLSPTGGQGSQEPGPEIVPAAVKRPPVKRPPVKSWCLGGACWFPRASPRLPPGRVASVPATILTNWSKPGGSEFHSWWRWMAHRYESTK